MKSSPYTRYACIVMLFGFMWILNFFISPFIFLFGQGEKLVVKAIAGKINFFSWFINTDEPTIKECMYGDEKYLKERNIQDIENHNFFSRFKWYWIWNVKRNSFWYFRTHYFIPLPQDPDEWSPKKNTTKKHALHLCDYTDRGLIWTEEWRSGIKYFRYSFTKEIRFLWIFGKKIWNVQLGNNGIKDAYGNKNTNRYLIKSKLQKL